MPSDSFSIDPMMVNSATMGMNSLVGAGNDVTKALQVISPVIFAEIGSGVATSNAALENALAQSLMSALSLFGNTSSNVQAAASSYAQADGDTASTISGLSSGLPSGSSPLTDASTPPEASSPELADAALPYAEDLPGLAESTGGLAGFDASVLADASMADEGMVSALAGGAGALAEGAGALAGEAGALAGAGSSVLARLSGAGGSLLSETEQAAGSELSPGFSRFSAQTASVSEAWDGLSADEQQAMIESDPDAFGSLDGIPSEVRNYVNRGDLDDLVDDTEGEIEDLRKSASQAADDEDDKKASSCRKQAAILAMQLDGLRALQRQLRANKNAYLLAKGTDSNGIGRFIVAINNPDTADNVATLVPTVELGLNEASVSGLTGEGGYLRAAMNLAAAASEADPGQQTSVIVWANSASQFGPTGGFIPDPQAAAALSQFQNGLASTNVHGSDLHATVIGNHAGSIVVGDAAKLPGGLSADDLIGLGRPGLDASTGASPGTGSGSPAGSGGPQVWLYSNDRGDHASADPAGGTAGDTNFFHPGSPVMADMANVIIGNYGNIYHLSKNQ